nr:phage integrase Arm DNA-binding domain-containing protein [Klebsiella pneumoniae]
MAARPRKNNISIPNLYPLYSRKVNKVGDATNLLI